MPRQFSFHGSLLLIAVAIVLAALGTSGFLPERQDRATATPRAASARVSIDWPDALHPVTQVRFDRAMDIESVAAAIKVEPFVPLDLRWEGRTLYVESYQPLAADRRYQFILDTTATDAEGTPLDQVYHWGYVTGSPIASIVQPARNGDRSTPLVIQFTSPMEPDSVAHSLRIEPLVVGEIARSEENTLLTFTPARPLPGESAYTVHFDSPLQDASGGQYPPVEPLRFTTPPATSAVSPLEAQHPGAPPCLQP
jgi:hypothetical protein